MRRRRPEKRKILKDPIYNDITVAKFVNYIMKKGKLNTDEFFVINHLVITAILIVYFVYLFNTRKCKTNCIKSLEKKILKQEHLIYPQAIRLLYK